MVSERGAMLWPAGGDLESWFVAVPVRRGFWLICEPGHVQSFLVEGDERGRFFERASSSFGVPDDAASGRGGPSGLAGGTDTQGGSGWMTLDYTRRVTPPGAPKRGWFITIEGPEGSGKTTQASALVRHLEARGVDVLLTREPGGTWLGERIRDVLLARTGSTAPTDPVSDALLFNAARRQLVTEVIAPELAAGQTVVCARFADSTLAYQGYGAGVPLQHLPDQLPT